VNSRRLSVLLLLALALAGCGGSSSSPPNNSATTPPPTLPASTHVFLVVLENHSFSQVMGNPAMPYFNSLATRHGLARNYFANTHPSIGNYFMLTTGLIETNNDAFGGTVSDNNLVRALTGAGKTWKAYLQGLPSPGYMADNAMPYTKVHNPFAYLTDVTTSGAQAANMVPLGQLSADLSAGAMADFVYITADLQNDAHDCPAAMPVCTDGDRLATADAWLKANIDPIINSPAFANGLLIITFDEGSNTDLANGGGQVATVLVGPHVKSGFASNTFFQHQSTLRTILDTLHVGNLPNAAAGANSMSEFFQ